MVAIKLQPKTEKRLEALAKRAGRSKAFFAREAIEEHIGELEDGYVALQRLKRPARRLGSAEVKRELGL
jgi:RHH-type transcriptional regulator, rel operon repressor / antitoxin RelB